MKNLKQNRFIRDYKLTLTFDDREVVIVPQIQIAFSGDKSSFGGLNSLEVQIYNLTKSNRDLIVRRKIDQNVIIKLKLEAGYQGNMSTIYKGTVFEASTAREGADMITNITCMDGGEAYYRSYTSKTLAAGVDVNLEVVNDMKGVEPGIIEPKILTRPVTLEGNPIEIIRDNLQSDQEFFIDNEKAYIVNKNAIINSFITVVDASTGLINVPQIDSIEVTFETLMNPSIRVGEIVSITSTIDKRLNKSRYRVRTINYSGNSNGQEWTQTVTCVPENLA